MTDHEKIRQLIKEFNESQPDIEVTPDGKFIVNGEQVHLIPEGNKA